VRGIVLRADDDKIIPGDLLSVDAEAFADEFLLGLRVMHEHKVSIASPRRFERLTRALRYHVNSNPGCIRDVQLRGLHQNHRSEGDVEIKRNEYELPELVHRALV
jgi:hypothetical protein